MEAVKDFKTEFVEIFGVSNYLGLMRMAKYFYPPMYPSWYCPFFT